MNKPNVDVLVGGPRNDYKQTYKSVILRANLGFKEQVTQPNTKYVVKYDFDLKGDTVTMPENCILEFDGGTVVNGRVVCNKTNVIYKEHTDFDTSVFYGNFKLNGSYIGDKYNIEALHGFLSVNDFFSPEDNLTSAQSIVYAEIDGAGYYFAFIMNSSDKSIQNPVCVLFDSNFNYLGKSTLDVVSHANDATVMEGVIYIASCLPTRNDIDYIDAKTLKDNCINQVTSKVDSITLDAEIVSIDYCDVCKELCVYKQGHLFIYDTDLKLKRSTSTNLKTTLMAYLDSNLVSQGMVYSKGIAYFDFWAKETGGSSAGNVATICAYDSVNNEVVYAKNLAEQLPVVAEPEGICKKDGENWIMIANVSSPAGYIIYNINISGEYIIPYRAKQHANTFFSAERVALYYIDPSYTGFSNGNKITPYKTLDSALLLVKGPSTRTEFYLARGHTYRISTINVIGTTTVFDRYGSGETPVIDGSLTIKQGEVIIKNVNFINTLNKAVVNISQNGFCTVTNCSFEGRNAEPKEAFVVSESTAVLNENVSFNNFSTVFRGQDANIRITSYNTKVTDCSNFITRTSGPRLGSYFIEFYISDLTGYNFVTNLFSVGVTSGVARIFFLNQITLENNLILPSGIYYWNGSSIVSAVGRINYVWQFNDTTKDLIDKTRGAVYYSTSIKKTVFGNGSDIIEADGVLYNTARSGTKEQRPSGSTIYVGFQYMQVDAVNGTFPIWASAVKNGTVTWVNSDGTVV